MIWRDRVVPWLVEKACRSGDILAERQRWIPAARGRVLEVGVGSGLNLAFYDAGKVEHVTGIDPSQPLLTKARPRAASAPVSVELVKTSAEALPFSNHAFDSAVVTYSLCSIGDPARALAEVRRVLVPSGQLVFVEHGLAPDRGPRRVQRWLTPLWSRVGGGCHLDRDIARLLRDAGFETPAIETRYGDARPWLTFTYQGIARRG